MFPEIVRRVPISKVLLTKRALQEQAVAEVARTLGAG